MKAKLTIGCHELRQRFHEINEKILNITIDGDQIVKDVQWLGVLG